MATAEDIKPAKPAHLNKPVRKFVKKNGKKLGVAKAARPYP